MDVEGTTKRYLTKEVNSSPVAGVPSCEEPYIETSSEFATHIIVIHTVTIEEISWSLLLADSNSINILSSFKYLFRILIHISTILHTVNGWWFPIIRTD
jgi:hypothetical protein